MDERITRGKAIRLKCLDCCCGNSAEVRRCPATNCPLWRYRLGNEKKATELSDTDQGEEIPAKGRTSGRSEAHPHSQHFPQAEPHGH